MSGLNKVMIIGNLGQDPEVRHLPDGSAVAKFSIATSEKWKDKATGQPVERTEWHNIVAFRKPAEILAQYLKKGSKVYIEGKLKTQMWEKDGHKNYRTEITVDQFQFLDSAGGQQSNQQSAPSNQQSAPDDFDDDIPF